LIIWISHKNTVFIKVCIKEIILPLLFKIKYIKVDYEILKEIY
jgi:hypothetical protein